MSKGVIILICTESIQFLITKNKDDIEILNLIEECLLSFSKYHVCIYEMELYTKLFGYHNMGKEEYQAELASLDNSRTMAHNLVISKIGILNRLCQQKNIPLVYEGVVSEERPHRVAIADAVLAYAEELVTNRPK